MREFDGGPDGRNGPHVFVADLDRPVAEDHDRRHLERVLRVRPGDPLTVSDGIGGWRPCRFGDDLAVDGSIVRLAAPAPALTIGFALVKGERPELVVQKLTELGVDRIVPFAAERSVVRWSEDRAGAHVERLRRVAREASMQSRRCWLPEVIDPQSFEQVAGAPGVVLADRGGPAPDADDHGSARRARGRLVRRRAPTGARAGWGSVTTCCASRRPRSPPRCCWGAAPRLVDGAAG